MRVKTMLRLQGEAYAKAVGEERADCVVRAMAKAFDVDYWTAHKYAARKGRLPRSGTYTQGVLGRKVKVIFGHRVSYHSYATKKHTKKVATFIKKHPEGTFILGVANHALTVKNGKITEPKRLGQHIEWYYRVTKINKPDPVEKIDLEVS